MEIKKTIRFCEIPKAVADSQTPQIFETFWKIVRREIVHEQLEQLLIWEEQAQEIRRKSDLYFAEILGYQYVEFENAEDLLDLLCVPGGYGECWCKGVMKSPTSGLWCVEIAQQTIPYLDG